MSSRFDPRGTDTCPTRATEATACRAHAGSAGLSGCFRHSVRSRAEARLFGDGYTLTGLTLGGEEILISVGSEGEIRAGQALLVHAQQGHLIITVQFDRYVRADVSGRCKHVIQVAEVERADVQYVVSQLIEVRRSVGGSNIVKDESIVSCATCETICVGPTIQAVMARTAFQGVVAGEAVILGAQTGKSKTQNNRAEVALYGAHHYKKFGPGNA